MHNLAKGEQDSNATSKSRKVRIPGRQAFRSLTISFSCFCQRRKTVTKPRDASTAAGDTAAESVRNLIKKNPKYSKRINYDALKELFVDTTGSPSHKGNTMLRDVDADLFVMDDDKSDGEDLSLPTVVVEEETGSVAARPLIEVRQTKPRNLADDVDIYDEASDEEKDDEMVGWDDIYEQEV